MKEGKKVISRRRFLGSAALGVAGIVVITGLASSCKSTTVNSDVK